MKIMRKKYVLLLIFFIFALVRFPISFAAAWFLPEGLELEGSAGTLWEGRASALGWQGSVVQKDLAWTFLPVGLFKGLLLWQISGKMNASVSQASLAIAPGDLELSNAQICLPAEPFFAQHVMMRSLRLGGDMKINSKRWTLRQPSEVLVNIQNLFSALTPDTGVLGDMQIRLSIRGTQAQWGITSHPGLLAVSGSGESASNRISGSLRLTIDSELDEQLGPLLAALKKETNGQYTLTLKN